MVDDSNNVFVGDFGNHRVSKWVPNATTGIVVAGGNGSTNTADAFNGVADVFVDAAHNIYVADQNNHRIQKWSPGAKEGVTVAGGNGAGSASNQINLPTAVFVDAEGNVYVGDWGSKRVTKWAVGATSGVTVAGGNGAGSNANQTDGVSGIYVDALGNVYVAEQNNHRISKWAVGATSGVTVAGGNGAGSSANQFKYPKDVYLDANGAMYIPDNWNQRVQKWLQTINTNYTPIVAGDYRAIVTNNYGCSATSNFVTITTNVTPTVSIVANTTAICSNTKVVFTVTTTNGGTTPTYQWKKNGNNVGTNDSTYKDSTLNANDSVWCVLTSNVTCAATTTAKSNVIKLTVASAPVSQILNPSVCDKYVYNNSTYISSVVIHDTLKTIVGCDSIYLTINATVNPSVTGRIYHPTKGMINNVKLTQVGSTNNTYNISGAYNASCLNANSNVSFKPSKNNEVTKANGVTSVDALLTQRHILNVTKLNSPYKIIAADVNGDKAINSVDVLRIKRLILGTDTTFTSTAKGNRLWEFVDSAYTFPDTTNPFPFKDSIAFTNLTSNKTNQTFIGVKLGDVNYDWNPAVAKGASIDNVKLIIDNVKLIIDNAAIKVDKQLSTVNYQLPIKVNHFKDIAAMQYTLHFDNTKYEFVGIENNQLNIDFNDKQANKTGNIAMLWTDKNAEAKTLDDGTALFTLILRSTVDRQPSTDFALTIDNSITDVEAWDKDFIQHNVILSKRELTDNNLIRTIQQLSIYPNPANNIVTIDCRNAKRIVIVDATGRKVYDKNVISNESSIINVKQFVKGIYIVQASLKDGGIINEKLVVE